MPLHRVSAGEQAQTAGYLNATSSLLGAGQVAKGWKTTNATRTPASGGNGWGRACVFRWEILAFADPTLCSTR